ncbi:MAG: fused response regulator/phosphatase [Planctomycetes bacterium]|nr:fused response regulator/phosphatase [Planctomycetota bacterium]
MSLVLISDDDPAVRAELKQVLLKAGHSVLEAATARATLHEAQDHDPDLILLDIKLPDMSVMELLEELRSEAALARVPIMMMAADADQDLLTRTFKWDIVDFVHKPFNTDILVAKIGAHTRLNLAYKFSRKLSKEMYMSRIERLETQVQATEEDMSEAERHFTWMQPKTPKVDGYTIEVKYRPYGKLGGDFYDFVWLDRDRLAVVVGDVSGHGIQAAILQTMARKLISLALRQELDNLQKVVEFSNRELTNDLPPGSFVAATIGVLNTETHEWRHVRCGIPYPILVKADRECEPLMTPGGPLGLSKKADWAIGVGTYGVTLEAGQGMLLMSDGIIECYLDDEKKEQFDVEGVMKAIKETPKDGSMIATICEKANLDHRADDDATLISIARK